MFVDELTIHARAGNGGNGVVRWLRQRHRPAGGPAGGNGGRGGDIYMRAVRDLALLASYTGAPEFVAERGEEGQGQSKHGKDGEDLIIDVPVGSIVTNQKTGERYEFFTEGEKVRILKGGNGGFGNEYFKSSTNRSPKEATPGKKGERADFLIELELVVDIGLVGMPNAGKSTFLNSVTNARSKVGDYPFTTLSPHLGDLYGFIIADIPGLIEGAATGKGLGHKFLRHVRRTKMLLHCISCEHEDPVLAYRTIRKEVESFDSAILEKPEWIVLTKKDLLDEVEVERRVAALKEIGQPVYAITAYDDATMKALVDDLVRTLRKG